MPEFLDGQPVALVFGFLFLGAMARGQMLYWLGRVATEQTLLRTRPTQGWRARAHTWLTGGGADPGIVAIRRWGLVMVPLSYLTVGFQSVVQAAAGVLRIALWQYTLAQVPGALAWAAIYTTFGFVTWAAVGEAARGNVWAVVVLLVAVTAVAVLLVRRRRR
ncbi:hypothetical protein [Georgenia alba]|uniref:Membrane protein DedA, SNARE-associated domain n=1 Tax=Georgenia alba TaxID=2233858 RepID=A0ABW2Q828_9MICO